MSGFATQLQTVSRQRKLDIFLKEFQPTAADRVLAIGVDAKQVQGISNMVEFGYPYPESMTGLTYDEPDTWGEPAKRMKLVHGDVRNMPFPDDSFEIAMANAVIEHVGKSDQQRLMISEMCRVAPRVFITTPNYYFPFELHTRLPFIQFLPARLRDVVLRRTGRVYWAERWDWWVNLLTARELRNLFPDNVDVQIIGVRVTAMAETLVAIGRRQAP